MPASLIMSKEERNEHWENNPPKPAALDAAFAASRKLEEDRKKAATKERIDKLRAGPKRIKINPADIVGKEWNSQHCCFVTRFNPGEITMTDKPDFKSMSGPELSIAYNEMVKVGTNLGIVNLKPTTKFKTLAVGVERCEKLHADVNARTTAGGQPPQEKVRPSGLVVKSAAKVAKVAKVKELKKKLIGGFSPDAKITVLVTENPRTGNVAKRFDYYKTCSTVGEYRDKVGNISLAGADLKWDVSHKYIEVKELK